MEALLLVLSTAIWISISFLFWRVYSRLLDSYERAQSAWDIERQALLDRIQSGSLAEFKHLTESHPLPKAKSPLRSMFADPDLIPED